MAGKHWKYATCMTLGLMFGGCLGGCTAVGTRDLTFMIMGQTFSVKDHVTAGKRNKDGVPEYRCTFDRDGWKAIFGWLRPNPEGEPEPAPLPQE